MSENMLFCLGEGSGESKGVGYQKNYQIFNQQVDKEEWNKIKKFLPDIKLSLNVWVDKEDMTDDEKDDNSIYKEIGGFLRTLPYKGSWEKWWSEAKQSDKDLIINLKYFKSDIFLGITGIDVKAKKSLSGKTIKVTIEDCEYEATIH
jgi:hypothetical protein